MQSTITIALGESHTAEAARLSASIPDLLIVNSDHPLYEERHADTMVNALLTKASFGKFLPDGRQGAVFLCDTDLQPVGGGNPFDGFPDMGAADIAFVAYPGRFFFPPSESYQAASYAVLGQKLNSGMAWFKDHATAKAVSAAWEAKYLEDISEGGAMVDLNHKNDEFSLMAVLAASNWNYRWLPTIWNNQWEPSENDIIRHSHDVPTAFAPQSETTPVPDSLANWRVKAVLDMQGLTPTVDAAVAGMPDGLEKIVISRAWNGNGDVLRHSPTVTSFMAILGLTDEQVDDMFRLAATFNP
jgi:hypothetical protein